jgi:hypothetical protein
MCRKSGDRGLMEKLQFYRSHRLPGSKYQEVKEQYDIMSFCKCLLNFV